MLIVTIRGLGYRFAKPRWELLLLAEVPVEEERLPLGIAGDPLPVTSELRVVGRQELEPGDRPLPELLDDVPVPEDGLDLPVRRQRTEVDDPHVSLRRLRLGELFGGSGHDERC